VPGDYSWSLISCPRQRAYDEGTHLRPHFQDRDPAHERQGLQVDVEDAITPERLLEVVADYDAVVVRSRTKIRKNVLEKAAKLKVIVRGGVGVDNIDVEAAEAKGVKVLNTPAASTDSVAELAIAYIFALARPVVQATESLRAGKWRRPSSTAARCRARRWASSAWAASAAPWPRGRRP